MKTKKSIKKTMYAAFLAFFLLGLAVPSVVFADDGATTELPREPEATEGQEIDNPIAESETPAEEPAAAETLPEQTSEVMQAIPEGTDLVVLDENGEALPLGSLEAEQVILEGDPMWCPTNVLPGGEGCTAGAASFLGENGLLGQLAGKSGNGTIYVSYDYSALTNVEDTNQSIVFDQTNDIRLANLGDLTIQGGWDFNSNALNGGQSYSVFNFGSGSFSIVGWTGDIRIKNIQFEDTTGVTPYGGSLAIVNHANGGDVLLQDVTVINSGGHAQVGVANERSGAYIDTKGNVTINSSKFDGNKSTGLIAASQGNVTLNNVQALANEGIGVWVDNCLYDYGDGSCLTLGSVTLSGTNTFGLRQEWINLGNTETGLYIQTGGKVSSDSDSVLKAQGNGWNGIEIERYDSNTSEAIELLGTNNFNENTNNGLHIYANGPITLHSINANSNSGNGTYIRGLFELDPDMDDWGYAAAGVGGTLTINGTNNFNGNGESGLEAYVDGKITASNLNASGNGYMGALLSTCAGFYDEDEGYFICYNDPDYDLDETYEFFKENIDYDVTISGTNVLNSNSGTGLLVNTYGDINLGADIGDYFTVQNNDYFGAELLSGIHQSIYYEDWDEWDLDWEEEILGGGNVTLKGTHLYGGYDSENNWGNDNHGLCIYAESDDPNNGNVTMKNVLEASGNGWAGVYIYATGFVNVTGSAKVFDSNEDGLYISNSNGAEISNIESIDNYDDGLNINDAYGDVKVSNVESSGNGSEGLDIYYFYDGAKLNLTSVTANDNGTGIWVGEDEDMGAVVVDQCVANGNYYSGMYYEYMSSLKISNSEVSGNGLDDGYSGIEIEIEGDVTLESVTANENGWAGIEIDAEDVVIKNATTSDNYGSGIEIYPTGNVLVKNSEASDNGENGLQIYGDEEGTPGDYTISCSTFNDNAVYGLNINMGDTVNLWGVNASGNGELNINTSNVGEIIESLSCDGGGCVCQPGDDEEPAALQGLVVPVVGSEKVALECGYAWTMLKLGSQDSAKFSGLCGSQLFATLSSFSTGDLPAPLPQGSVMGSGIEGGVDGAVILPDGGWMQISFNVPADLEGKTLSILFWDSAAGEWVEIPLFGEGGFAASDTAMQVLSGVQVNPDGTVTITVNFGGTFVLVGR